MTNIMQELIPNPIEMMSEILQIMAYLRQDHEEFYSMVRDTVQKRLRICYFEDDGTGAIDFQAKYKHWWYIPFYWIFRDRKRILVESVIIVAEEYLFKLTKRKIVKGKTGFVRY